MVTHMMKLDMGKLRHFIRVLRRKRDARRADAINYKNGFRSTDSPEGLMYIQKLAQ